MPSPKIFVSSTCYDLGAVREQLRNFLFDLGYDPILSEYSDILYDPRTHTHTSCLQEVPGADMVVLIVGSRFGGKAVPEALNSVSLERISNAGFDVSAIENISNLSVTQLEVLKAVESQVPVFAFVDEKVWHDHLVFEKNKDLVGQIRFPSIEKPETAKYTFEFINFLKSRIRGNSVVSFSKIEDIENHLRKQWASLFQRLLRESREKEYESRRMFGIAEQIEDLKTAVLSTIANTQSREIARGAIKYRRLVDFLMGLRLADISIILRGGMNFEELLKRAGIVQTLEVDPRDRERFFGRTILVKDDGTFYELRFPIEFLNEIGADWLAFVSMPEDSRRVIYEALSDSERMGAGLLRYRKSKFEEYHRNADIQPELYNVHTAA
ncbi:DUF4062 domain-containing protein [Chitinimonas taiwanensis]|uniref:DUF4062 domain-containing protein n=1 Tax=Chitinimonas taiwanensis DSM 18899 TaxID=1121279 RepID=A0A1K2HMI0_9NEIS|nr:DUF4062 domain-containing protein [Chitinimonas taiwanensis]SFZ77998.1 protein of unknown function [Chitinimonas taiwanensis DSM 18899]